MILKVGKHLAMMTTVNVDSHLYALAMVNGGTPEGYLLLIVVEILLFVGIETL